MAVIRKVIIQNYKQFKNLSIDFNPDINIIVADNENGKSTLFEAIHLALSGKINNKPLLQELTPYLFNVDCIKEYIQQLKNMTSPDIILPPSLFIELYFQDEDNEGLAQYKGTNNSLKENATGLKIGLIFDDDYLEEYKQYISNPQEVTTIPIEYYKTEWWSFAFSPIKYALLPIKSLLIDNISTKFSNGIDKFVTTTIENILEKKDNVALSLKYRQLKQSFSDDENITKINHQLSNFNKDITDKNMNISVDISSKSSWDMALSLYLDEIPFNFMGKGEQNSIKAKLSLKTKTDKYKVILIEEPETNQSYSNMSKLINFITKNCSEKQIFISTHSSYVLNKSGIDKAIFLNQGNVLKLNELTKDTYEYFKILPGYDTLRLILSKKSFLVEGPSDELIIQAAYKQKYGKLPIEDGIDVICVRGLSFLRFLEIADKLDKDVTVFTDNDGDYENNIKKKYQQYENHQHINVAYSTNNSWNTLEPQIAYINKINTLCTVLSLDEKRYNNNDKISEWMQKNKTDSALRIYTQSSLINFPEYINNGL